MPHSVPYANVAEIEPDIYADKRILTLPREIIICGKGPSLVTFDWSKATGVYKLCVNDAVFVVPKPDAAIGKDYETHERFKSLDPKIQIWCADRTHSVHYKNEFRWREPLGGFQASACAIIVAYYHGVRKINFIGYDSVDYSDHEIATLKYATGMYGPEPNENRIAYAWAREQVWHSLLERPDLEYRFWHRETEYPRMVRKDSNEYLKLVGHQEWVPTPCTSFGTLPQ